MSLLRKQYRFTTLFFVMTVGALMIPGLLGIFYSTSSLDKVLTTQTDQENRINLQVVSEKLAHYFKEPVLELDILRSMIINKEDYLEGFSQIQASGHGLMYFKRLILVDGNASIIAVWPKNSEMLGLDQSGKGFIERAGNGSVSYFWSGTYVDYYTGKTSIDLIVPLKQGYLSGTVILDGLQGLINEIPNNSEAIIGIVDSNGSYLAHSNPAMVEQRMKDPLFYRRSSPDASDQKTILIDHHLYLPYQKNVEGTDWTIVSYYPLEVARNPVDRVLVDLGIAQGVMLLIIALLFLLMGRIFFSKVEKIQDFTEQIAEGRYDIIEPRSGFIEMANILQHFEHMAHKVQEREMEIVSQNEEIFAMNEELEARVMERTAQLEAVNRELESFSYSVSHDLRAPLRHIKGFVQLLDKQLGDVTDEKSKHYLSVIAKASEQMGRLIDDLLSYSKMGRIEMMNQRVNCNALVQEVIDSLTSDTEGQNVIWKIGQLPDAQGDREMLRLVWTNLISNGLKFSRGKEHPIIEIGTELNRVKSKNETVYFIRDNGAGFDMHYKDKLFGVFQRLHSQEEFEGTGVGLANVKGIITRHGGQVWAESAPDAGAVFYFTLPAYKDEVQ